VEIRCAAMHLLASRGYLGNRNAIWKGNGSHHERWTANRMVGKMTRTCRLVIAAYGSNAAKGVSAKPSYATPLPQHSTAGNHMIIISHYSGGGPVQGFKDCKGERSLEGTLTL
jgi:hypothetical protein